MSPETSGNLGDIFWDLPSWTVYTANLDLGCTIYVANPTDTEKEYSLMARLSRNSTAISEEVLPVYGLAWFKVNPGDLVTLKGALRFSESNASLTVYLVERETEEWTDEVTTLLVPPSSSALPPGWPSPGTTAGFDWNSLLAMMLPVVMLGIVAVAVKPQKEPDKKVEIKPSTEMKQLPEEGKK
jgi:hypothetical protein